MSPSPRVLRFISIERRTNGFPADLETDAFSFAISAPCFSNARSSIPPAIFRPLEWSVMAMYSYDRSLAALAISTIVADPSLQRVCICKSPRSLFDHAGLAARSRRAAASETKS